MSDDDHAAGPGTMAGATRRALRALNRPATADPLGASPNQGPEDRTPGAQPPEDRTAEAWTPEVETPATDDLGSPGDDDVLAAEIAVAESDLSGPPVDDVAAAVETPPVAAGAPIATTPRVEDADVAAPPAPPVARPGTDSRSAAPSPAGARLYGAFAFLALAALVFAVVAGVVWWRAGHSSQRTQAQARDEVALQTRLDVAALTASDYRHSNATVVGWLSHTTGDLRQSLASQQQHVASTLASTKTIATSTVIDVAVTAVDTGKGNATALASVNITKKDASGKATSQPTRARLVATMTRVDGVWKLADLQAAS